MTEKEKLEMKTQQYRQGDVLLVKVSAIPKDAKRVKEKGRVVLAHGEVTGHAHAIYETKKARLFDANAERYLQVAEKVALSHEEHTAIVLTEGKYQQAFQVRDFGEEVRRVAD